MIVAHNVCQVVPLYDGELTILKGVNFSLERGQSAAIIGESGSGKTTFLGILAGLDSPTSGSISINDTEITSLNEEERAVFRQKTVAFVFQNFQLLESLTALENVMLPLEVNGDDDAKAKAEKYLAKVGLERRLEHYPNQLSGGEQQRVALARAFACDADIIFADEPTGNLDTKTGNAIADLLFTLNEEQQTSLVLVTHSPTLAERCDRRFDMDSGYLSEVTES